MNTLFTFDKTIQAGNNRFLADIIPANNYTEWFNSGDDPKIYVLNKGICGNGGTTGFIRYAKKHNEGLICIVPNVSIVQSKEIDNDICCVYGSKDLSNLNKQIKICTWDKSEKVIADYASIGLTEDCGVWKNRLLVIDEYHKLVDDSSYREICANVVKIALESKINVVLMSATPDYQMIEFLKKYSGKEVITTDIKYYDSAIEAIGFTSNFRKCKNDNVFNIIEKTIQSNISDGHICFFYNNVTKINEFVSRTKFKNEIEVLCSKKNKKDCLNFSEKFDSSKKIHFLTSAYFTGMDIDENVNRVIILGGNDGENMAYSANEIKQMLGRFRKDYNYCNILKLNNTISKEAVAILTGEMIKNEKLWNAIGDDLKKQEIGIEIFLKMQYCKNKIEAFNGWNDTQSFKKMMSKHVEYKIKEESYTNIEEDVKKERAVTFKEFKTKYLTGEDCDFKYKNACIEFIKNKGEDAFRRAEISEIKRWYKLFRMDINFDDMTPEELYDTYLGNGIYSRNYLTSLLDFIGCNQTGNIELDIQNTFGCICMYFDGKISREREQKYITFRDKFGENSYRISNKFSPELSRNVICNISQFSCYQGNAKYCKTIELSKAEFGHLSCIKSGLDKLVIDNPEQIKDIKADPGMKKEFDIWKGKQSQISEFYKSNATKIHPFKKDQMDSIDTLIVDIDNSISFNEFKKDYSHLKFTAYPSISNTNKNNWNKYRVIFYLQDTLQIPNDSLLVLKFLRKSVCKYEDPNHQMYSYVNHEQYDTMKVENDGALINFSQQSVNWLSDVLNTINDYSKKRISSSGEIKNVFWDLERAKQHWQANDKDDFRYKATFRIKVNLSTEDRVVFRDWLSQGWPDKVHHWDQHKKI